MNVINCLLPNIQSDFECLESVLGPVWLPTLLMITLFGNVVFLKCTLLKLNPVWQTHSTFK
jgi:hypothetical protein